MTISTKALFTAPVGTTAEVAHTLAGPLLIVKARAPKH